MSAASFVNSIATRRTTYQLAPVLPEGVSIDKVNAFIQTIIQEIPTAFNSQSNRAVILTGASHKKAWDKVVNDMPNDNAKMRPISARDEAYGTVVFMTDDKTIDGLEKQYAAFAHVFSTHATTSSGAAQITSWAALEQLGLGCHLQHYNAQIKPALPTDTPKEWTVTAQLVFGARNGIPDEKTYINNPVKLYG